MTETGSKVRKTGASARKASGKAKRDAYDDYLDMLEGKPVGQTSSAAKSKGKTALQAKPANAAKPAAAKESTVGKKAEAKPKTSEAKTGTARKSQTAAPQNKSTAVKKASAGQAKNGVPAQKKSAGTKGAGGKNVPKEQPDLLAAWEELSAGAEKSPARKSVSRPRSTAVRSAQGGSSRPRTTAPRPAAKSGTRSGNRRSQAVLAVSNGPRRDAYDDFLEAAERKRPRKKSGGRASGLTVVLIAAILCVLGLGVWQTIQYRTFLVMKAAVNHAGFYEGTTVEGVDVSDMTLQQAVDYWKNTVEPSYSQRTVTLSNGASFTAAELGYSSDYETVLTNAWSAGRSGTLQERYEAISTRRMKPVSYTVTRHPYSQEAVAACITAIAAQIDKPAKDAGIASFDMSNYSFSFSDEETGSQLDKAALAQGMVQALEAGGGTVDLVVQAIQPKVRKADIASQYGMITAAVTNASSSSSNRLTNIRLSLQLINGTCLEPGETFSFNDTVGKRTSERGFKVATAYAAGEVTEEVGGGICQVSTTLFNAAVKADLEIVERHNHSLTVGYVDLGKDAAVNWSSQDLRFTNNGDDDIYICCLLDDSKRVRVGIFGKLLPNGESITVEGVTTGTVDYETVHQPSLNLMPGTSQVAQKGKVGYTAEAYKIRWDANGNQISRELLCKSRYKATKEIIEYGP